MAQSAVDQFGNPLPGMSANPQTAGQPGAPANPQVPNMQGALTVQQPAAQQIGGGIAGVASKITQDGIKIYKDQKTYNKWEFVYDITKDTSRVGGAAAPRSRRPRLQEPLAPPMGNESGAAGAEHLGVNPGMNPGMNPGTAAPVTTPNPSTP